MKQRSYLPGWILYALVAITSSVVALAVVGALYVNSSVQQSEQKWCDLMVMLDNFYQQQQTPGAPPLSPARQELAKRIHELRFAFDCP